MSKRNIRVYVAGRYLADNVIDVLKNIGRGEKACAELFKLGFYPFSPWADRSFVTNNPDDVFTVEEFYKYSIAWLEVSDVMLVLPGFKTSGGTMKEIEIAAELGIPVFYTVNGLIGHSDYSKGFGE